MSEAHPTFTTTKMRKTSKVLNIPNIAFMQIYGDDNILFILI
jgi:hypothetical protein